MSTSAQVVHIDQILALINDPLFLQFDSEQRDPSLFLAAGRTFTETWHSALLAELLNPAQPHGLDQFPLKRLCLLLQQNDQLPPAKRGIHLAELVAHGDLLRVQVSPHRPDRPELTVPGIGRFDILIEGIRLKCEVQLLIELKVRARIEPEQCHKYIEWVRRQSLEGVVILPIFIAPAAQLHGTPQALFGDPEWIPLSFQELYDQILEPCLQHPALSAFGQELLRDYIKTLKHRAEGERPLIVTKRERELIRTLYGQHPEAIRALYEILSEQEPDYQPLPAPKLIKIKIGDAVLEQSSIGKLYVAVLHFLDERDDLGQVPIPFPTSPVRYLLAREPKHQKGNPFVNPVEYHGYFMEANKDRQKGLRDLGRLLKQCGLTLEILE